jgi:hypothetical protein
MLSRIFVMWAAVLLLLSGGLLAIALLLCLVGLGTGGPDAELFFGAAILLGMPGIVSGLLGGLTLVSGQYLRRMRSGAFRLSVIVAVLRSLAIVALSGALYHATGSWRSGYVLLFLIPEIIVAIYLWKFRLTLNQVLDAADEEG